MRYHFCPVCGKKGYYKPSLKWCYEMNIQLQYAPRCKFCNYYLPYNGHFMYDYKNDPWKKNWINAKKEDLKHPMDGEK